MFESTQLAPPDPILGLTEAFLKDPNPDKINLSVGVFKDASGSTPVLSCVKEAEARILREESTKSYKPIHGTPEFAAAVQELLFGEGHEIVTSRRAATAHTPGGTGALRVAGNCLKQLNPKACVWVSQPTWANHPNVFKAAGFEVKTYPYFDASSNRLDVDSCLRSLGEVPQGDVVLLHACCHNPSGIDPGPEEWVRIAEIAGRRGFLPLLDFAYQGFGGGLEEDAAGLREMCRPGLELMVCSSFSKNFGLYNERVGALTIVAGSEAAAQAVLSHVKVGIRANYSNPPAHGGEIVTTVLGDPELRALWEREVAVMRERIHEMRRLFVRTLAERGVQRDFSFIEEQKGMFSFSGLSREQVKTLREKESIYIVGSGRINMAGMTEGNIARLCDAIARVL